MANLTFTVDSSQVSELSKALAHLTGQFDWITARAMTNSAKAAKNQLATTILPRIEGGPTAWTRRGLMVSFAKPDNLVSNVGWNYGDGSFSEWGAFGSGTPSGRYMGLLSRGGDRRPKSTEVRLRRAGIIGSDQFITPATGGTRLNKYGNVSSATYTQLLSRLKVQQEGSTSAASGPGSRGRTAAKRRQLDYFVMRDPGDASSRFIARRVGRRGFVPAFFITDQPNYERRFDVQGVALREYNRNFAVEFERGLQRELARRAGA